MPNKQPLQKLWVVVSRFNGDVSWTQRLAQNGHPVLIYEHVQNPNSPYNIGANKGNEAAAYFKFIVDFYESLPYTIAFVHDHDTSWHHQGSIVDLILLAQEHNNSHKNKIQYKSLNNLCTNKITGNPLHHKTIWFYNKYIKPYIGTLPSNDWTYGQHCCAQFVIDKKRIIKLPKQFYSDIYQWILKTKWEPKVVGHVLEWTYTLIFNNGQKQPEKCKRII